MLIGVLQLPSILIVTEQPNLNVYFIANICTDYLCTCNRNHNMIHSEQQLQKYSDVALRIAI